MVARKSCTSCSSPSGVSFSASTVLAPTRSGKHRSEEHTSELQSLTNLVCRLLLEKKKKKNTSSGPKLKHTKKEMAEDEGKMSHPTHGSHNDPHTTTKIIKHIRRYKQNRAATEDSH